MIIYIKDGYEMNILNISGLLFATPSFWGGVSRCLDIGATQELYNESPNEYIADYNAIASDWAAIGIDMESAINNFESKYS